jgi:CHAT domain-containing protein/tetratricopeptide (TPR) repeat protein
MSRWTAAPAVETAERPAPRPSPTVQMLLDEAIRLTRIKEFPGALKAGDRALAAARSARDQVGQAQAQEACARALEGLRRPREAMEAWRAAVEAWAQTGDGPGQVGALLGAALLQVKGNTADAEALFAQALGLAQTEARRPLAAALAIHTAANDLFGQGEVARARQFWAAALAIREKLIPDSLEVAKSLYDLGLGAGAQGELRAAEAYYQRALTISEKLEPNSVAMAQTLNNLGVTIREQGDLKTAASYYRRALTLFQKLTPDSMDVGRVLGNLGVIADAQGELGPAWDYYERALTIFTKREPNSLEAARMLQNLGVVTHQRGDLAQAAVFYRRALVLQQKLAPDSQDMARSLGNLANVAVEQGDLKGAESCHQRALAIFTRLAPDSLSVAMALCGLGNVATEQGALEVAKARYGQALAIQERLAPGSLEVAASLDQLGRVAAAQGDREAAAGLYKRALAIRERWAPDALDVAASFNNLGNLAKEQAKLLEDLEVARDYYQRALNIQEKLAPVSLDMAASLGNLANIAVEKREFKTAEQLYYRSLMMEEKLAPNSSAVTRTLHNLGIMSIKRGDLSAAKGYYQRALSLQEKLAPNSLEVAHFQFNLAGVTRSQGKWREAERWARQAWDLVHRQAAGVTGDESRQAFGSNVAVYATRLVRAQVVLGKVGPAFAVLDEGRGQALQQLLIERQLTASLVPGSLWPRYRAALADRDRAEQAISQASVNEALARRARAAVIEEEHRGRSADAPASGNQAAVAQQRATAMAAARQLVESRSAYTLARVKADQLWAEIKKRAPRAFAPLLSVSQSERALPADLLFAAFAVGEEETELFLLRRTQSGGFSLSAHSIAATPDQLRDMVRGFREQVTDPDADNAGLVAASRALFDRLFPLKAQAILRNAHRLLISPDGPLWELPFAALITNRTGPPQYLGGEKAITYTPSLSLFAQSRMDRPRLGKQARQAGGGGAPWRAAPATGAGPRDRPVAVVVGDPIFERKPLLVAPAPSATPPVREHQGERTALFVQRAPPARLPETRREAEQIARLYGSKPLLGEQATEAALRRRIGGAAVIHLATHGFLNPVRAMSSGVLLTVPEPEPAIGQTANDGALQAWEIYSQLHLKAELVVLSACETGRGENVAGEGIVGLTRALQYAGARSVVASQWKVADQSTATLMVAFHEKLRQGMPKDEALQEAMAAVRRNPRTAHPYYWAPFVLVGDPDYPNLGAEHRRRLGSPQ